MKTFLQSNEPQVFMEWVFYNILDEWRKNGAVCRNTPQVVKLKMQLLHASTCFPVQSER